MQNSTCSALLIALALSAPLVTALPAASDLRVEYLRAPINVGIAKPRFSFVVNWDASTARATAVAAHRITVTEVLSGATVWDSGMTASNATSQIEYAGSRPLQPDTDYSWSVQWQSGDGTAAPAANSTFSTALLSAEDWQGAEWIGSEEQRVLRTTLKVTSASILRARAYVAAPGCYALYVNNRPAGDEMGVCPWTQFDRRVLYDAHDIAPLLTAGDNTVELVLGRGMYVSKGYAKNAAAMALFTATLGDGKHTRLALRSAGSPPPPPPTPPPPAPTPRLACAVVPEHTVATLGCPAAGVIKNVTFGSFGTPSGKCSDPATQAGNTFHKDASCDAPGALEALRELCVGKQSCMVKPGCTSGSCTLAGGSQTMPDPCHMVHKHLAAAIECGSSDSSGSAPEDGHWLAAAGPIKSDDPYIGCTTDVAAANNPSAWLWVPAQQSPQPPAGDLHAMSMPASRRLRTLIPVAARVVGNGHLRFDFAENFVGVTEINVTALAPLFGITGGGADVANFTVVAKHGEITDGLNFTVPTAGTGNVSFPWTETKQTDHYLNVNVGAASPNLRPRFVWHGFQFVEISIDGASATAAGAAKAIASGAVAGINIGTDLETTGDVAFDGDATGQADAEHILNQIQRLVTNSQKANVAAGMPTDCPTREKHGWLGDAQVTAEEAMMNFNMAPVYTEFLRTIRDSQQGNSSKRGGDVAGVVPVNKAPPRLLDFVGMAGMVGAGPDGITDISWSAAYPLITRWMLLHYGDTRVVVEHFDALDAFMNDLTTHAAATSVGGLPDFYTWGDWCAVEARSIATPGTGPALAAFNYLLGVDAMAHMANAIGRESDGARYTSLAAKLRPVFRSRFFNSSTGAYGQRELELQSLTAAPLALGGVVQPGAEYDGVIAALKKDVDVTQAGHFTVGSAGAKHLLVQLSGNGLHKEAMRVATQRDFPSFGFWLANGATTCWENYRGYADPSHPPAPTRNHIFLCGGVGEWMYRQVAGVAVAADGYERVAVAPHITAGGAGDTGPAAARATLRTVRGVVAVSWARAPTTGVQLAVNVTVPLAVAGAAVTVPSLSTGTTSLTVHESGNLVWKDGSFVKGVAGITGATSSGGEGGITFEVASGAYQFTTA